MKTIALVIAIAFSAACATPDNYRKPRSCYQKMTRAGQDGAVNRHSGCAARGNW